MLAKSLLLRLLFKPVFKHQLEHLSGQSSELLRTQQPLPGDRNTWSAYWKAHGQPWRTEPEIEVQRQRELAGCRDTQPDSMKGIYPFKGMKLSRADVEWLLATHNQGQGPILGDIATNGGHARGLDLRGADLRFVDLNRLPLAQLRGGMSSIEWPDATKEQREAAAVHLEGAILDTTDLTRATFRFAHLEGANLRYARLNGAVFQFAYLAGSAEFQPTNLQSVSFDHETILEDIIFANKKYGTVQLADVHWGDVKSAVVDWTQMNVLGDEQEARRSKNSMNENKSMNDRFKEYQRAVRANRQLAVALQSQGLNEEATRFAYRAQVLQKHVWWFQIMHREATLRQREQALGAWFFSWFLYLVAGYGYRLWRGFLVYIVVVMGFAILYHMLGSLTGSSLSLVNALALSMTSFHGRGFFPGVTQLNTILTLLASIEAFVGLILEVTLIATLTQRFFGK